nr:hypothetical protein [Prolixibacteraceae bacterium]
RNAAEINLLLGGQQEKTPPNWWILGGSAAFVAFTLGMGFSNIMSRLKAIDGRIELSDNGSRGFAVSITCPAVPFRSGEKESRT